MAQLKFFGVATLPAQLEADAFYFVQNGNYAESYVTNNSGVARMIGNSAMINALIAAELANWTGSSNQVQIAADMTARDALASTATHNLMVVVIDASGDPTVDSGSALYAYDLASTTWFKLAEYESMDIVVQWGDIQGGPSSTPAQIDSAVSQSHSHSNMAQLNKIGEDGNGGLTYGGVAVKTQWEQKTW